MQTILSSVIILIAVLYLANQWLPHKLKRRVMQMFGRTMAKPSTSACGSCSSCDGCGNNANFTFKGISITRLE